MADLQPAWLWLDGATLEKQFGVERLAYFQPYRTLFDHGVVIGGGSDHMQKIGGLRSVNPYNPFLGMWIVLTRQPGWQAEGAEAAHSPEEALALAGSGAVEVIGGNDMFELFLPLATRLEITAVHEDTAGDVFMAAPGPEWREVAREEHPAQKGDPAYAFVTLEKLPSRLREGLGVGL